MALPKLNSPIYTLVLPSTGEEVKYRPFLVKEQKLLMIAQESNQDNQIYETMTSVIRSCTFGKVNAEVSPLFDVEFVFLKLRSKSVGESAKLRVLCPDDEETYAEVQVNIDEIEVKITKEHNNEISLTESVKLVMKYPVLGDMKGMIGTKLGETEQIFNLLEKCIWEIHDGDVVHHKTDIKSKDLKDFIESLSTEQFDLVVEFFNTMPKLRHAIEVENPKTKVKSEVLLEGLESFLA